MTDRNNERKTKANKNINTGKDKEKIQEKGMQTHTWRRWTDIITNRQ